MEVLQRRTEVILRDIRVAGTREIWREEPPHGVEA